MKQSKYKIIPYGVDFLKKSIQQAKEEVMIDYKENFIVGNFLNYNFKRKFDYIIFDPMLCFYQDLSPIFNLILNNLNSGGKMFLLIHFDEAKNDKEKKAKVDFLQKKGVKFIKDRGFYYAEIHKK